MPAPTRRMSTALTAGARARLQAHVLIGLAGAAVAFVIAVRIGEGAFIARPLAAYDIWLVLSGAIGANAGLFLMRHHLGGRGLPGALRGVAGAIFLSLSAAVIGGSLALPLYGTMFGPFTLLVTLGGAPILAVAWMAVIALCHLSLRAWHDERDSIFVPAGRAAVSRSRGNSGST